MHGLRGGGGVVQRARLQGKEISSFEIFLGYLLLPLLIDSLFYFTTLVI